MKKLIRNKKGVDSFTFLLTIFAILVLGFILVGLTMKYNKLNNTIGEAGSSASSILSAYASADRALLYLDNAVGMSMDNAVYDLAYNGFYLPATPSTCGLHYYSLYDNYQRWSEGLPTDSSDLDLRMCNPPIDNCVPAGYDANFKSAFMERLNGQVSAYNNGSEVNISGDGYELQPGKTEVLCPDRGKGCGGRNEGPFQLVGKTDKPMNMSSRRVNYTIMPSFRENADVDLAGHFKRITEKGNELVAAVEEKPSISMSELAGIIKKYNEKENDLEWSIAMPDNPDCSPFCDTGESCPVCITCCSSDDGEGGEGSGGSAASEGGSGDGGGGEGGGGDGSGGGGSGGGEKCSTVCVPGKIARQYCDHNLGLSVKIVDDAYKLKGEKKGYAGFVAENSGKPEVKKYEYRFSFNWADLQTSTTCIPIGDAPSCG